MKIFTTLSLARAIKITGSLVEKLPRDIDKKIYVFCESKATLSFEKEITRRLGGSFNVEVMSFSRYVSKNVKVENYLNKAEASLLVRRLMKENEAEFLRLKTEQISVPSNVYGLISQFKAAMIKPDDLGEILKSESGALGAKLNDVFKAYSFYEDYLLKNGLTDESNYLSLMVSALKKDALIKGAKVIVAGIQSFTKQNIEIIKTLAEICDVDFVTVSSGYPGYTNESVNKISSAFPYAEVIPVNDLKKEQNAIARWLFDPEGAGKNGKFSDKIKISEAKSVFLECDKIAARIRYEVVKNGYRYRDFSVITSVPEDIAPLIKESFSKYDIPLYSDTGKTLQDHPVIGLIGALIDVKRFNYATNKVIKLVQNGLFCSYEESRSFIKYVYENAVSRKQFKEPFSDLVSESVRKRVISATEKLKAKDTQEGYVSVVKESLLYLDVYSRAEKFSEKLSNLSEGVTAEFNLGAMKALPDFLDGIAKILGKVKSGLIEFKHTVIGAAKSVAVSGVPEYNDTVYLGDYRAGRIKESKILFMPCLSGEVPFYKADVALLNDRELTKMDGYKLVIEPKLQIVNERERENIVASMIGFTDKLYLSFSTVDKRGKPTLKSRIIDSVINIFSDETKKLIVSTSETEEKRYPELNFMSEKAGVLYSAVKAEKFSDRLSDDTSDIASFYQAISDKRNLEKAIFTEERQIFSEGLKYDGKFSATFIETYFSCPYKALCQNVLKLKEASDGETKVYEIGNVLHNVMENFIKKYPENEDETGVEILASDLFEQELKMPLYARYLNKPQYKHIFALLKKEAVKECKKVYSDIENSSFKPMGAEIEFNEYAGNGLKPLILETNNKTVTLRGKIDRADAYCDENNKYFRIIDYKSGSAASDDGELYCGNKIQLYLYMNVFTEKGFKPVGAHYFKLSDDFSPKGTSGGEYLGKSLADARLIGKLDNEFALSGVSKNLGVKLKKDGEFSQSASLLSADEFKKYIDYAKKVAAIGAEEIGKGLFIPSPVPGSCEFCKYKGMCGYDCETDFLNRDVSGAKKQSILNAEEDHE